MTVAEVFELRKQGFIEEAYDAMRQIYATDKSKYASLAMFWTANDVLKSRLAERRTDEAQLIFNAMQRLLPGIDDLNGWVKNALLSAERKLQQTTKIEMSQQDKAEHLQLGSWGEGLAATFLREKGYVILERDWHSKHRDIDIIARDGNVVVFVEVKTRRNRDFGEPYEAVNYRKRKNLQLAINHYIKYHYVDGPVRFDIVSIVGTMDSTPEITHLEGVDIMHFGRW